MIFGLILDREAKKWPIGHFSAFYFAFLFCLDTGDHTTAKVFVQRYFRQCLCAFKIDPNPKILQELVNKVRNRDVIDFELLI